MEPKYAYNPCDEGELTEFLVSGHLVVLPPNAVTELKLPEGFENAPRFASVTPALLLETCLQQLAIKGVCEAPGPEPLKDDNPIRVAAEDTHTRYLHDTYAHEVVKFDEETGRHMRGGMRHRDDTPRIAGLRKRLTTWGVFAALLLGLLSLSAGAQQPSTQPRPITAKYNLTSGTETFCAFDQAPITVTGNITTSGSSTTVTAVSTATPFQTVSIGDQLIIGGASAASGSIRTVTARASNVSITVDSAINLSSPTTGYPFQYRKLQCSTDGTSGSFATVGYSRVNVDFNISLNNTATGISMRLQCKAGDLNADWKQLYPVLTPPTVAASFVTFTTTGGFVMEGIRNYSSCRVGIKCTSACTQTEISMTGQMEVLR